MEIIELPYKSPFLKSDEHILLQRDKSYFIWRKSDLKEIFKHSFTSNYVDTYFLGDSFMFNMPHENKGFRYDVGTGVLVEVGSTCAIHKKASENEYFGINNSKFYYALLDSDYKEIKAYDIGEDVYIVFSEYGLIKFSRRGNKDKFFDLTDRHTEEVLFHLDLETHYSSFLLVDQYFFLTEKIGANNVVKCIDLKSKKLVWTLEDEWSPWIVPDSKNQSVVLSFNRKYYEMSMGSDLLINKFTVDRQRADFYPEKMVALTDSAIYFYNSLRENVLGRINRKTGQVEWESNYKPEGCKSLNIWFWDLVNTDQHLIKVFDDKNPKLLLMKE